MLNRIKIEIMGSQYTIASSEDEKYVLKLGSELDNQVRALIEASPKLSLNSALVLCALSYSDALKKSEESADHIRNQLAEYLDESTQCRMELEEAKREIERLKARMR